MFKALETATAAAKAGGKVLTDNFYGLKSVSQKGRDSVVTNIDLRSEKEIVDLIKKDFPEHGFYTEEKGHAKSDSEYTWYVDPLDGTGNYVAGIDIFCVGIALCKGNRPVVSAIYQPLQDELYQAVEGEGAYLNGSRINVGELEELERAVVLTDLSSKYDLRPEAIKNLEDIIDKARRIRMFGAVLSTLGWVAAKRFAVYYRDGAFPWDLAPGALLIREAGGVVKDWEGKNWDLNAKSVVAGNKKLVDQVLAIMKKNKK